jgi:integrase
MTRRGRGDGMVHKRADGRWEARLRYFDPVTDLSERISLYGTTRAEAVAKLDDARLRLRRRKSPLDESIMLADFLELWLEDVVKPTRREWTYRSYRTIVEQYLSSSRLGSVLLRDLKPAQIQHVLVAKAKAVSRSQQLSLVVLRRALSQAVEWQMLATNPAAGIAATRIPKRELRVLSSDEARAFLAAAASDRLYALYHLAIDTGMRQGELFALQWRDIDLQTGWLQVVRTVNTATGEVGPPKTKSSRRRIHLGSAARDVLEAHRIRMEEEGNAGGPVFSSSVGTTLNPANVRISSFLPLQLKAQIDPPIRFHDLRHTAATLMLGAGVHPKIVSERLGHATIAITMDTYQHVLPTMQREAADVMAAILPAQSVHVTKSNGGTNGGQLSASTRKTKKSLTG